MSTHFVLISVLGIWSVYKILIQAFFFPFSREHSPTEMPPKLFLKC